MSTRSYIGQVLPNGKIKAVYCHFDGYEKGVGATLKKFYTENEKVSEFMKSGFRMNCEFLYLFQDGKWSTTEL